MGHDRLLAHPGGGDPGARRVVDFAVEEVVELTRRPLPRRHLEERSRSNPPTAGAGMVAGPR